MAGRTNSATPYRLLRRNNIPIAHRRAFISMQGIGTKGHFSRTNPQAFSDKIDLEDIPAAGAVQLGK
ncbi:MAG TPA: hypothetical protein VHA37_00750, partial [Candidatus Saccharimonadales bacterium]|nr:hypothetical protein [Candidatus Saccharimonadales bacterium]